MKATKEKIARRLRAAGHGERGLTLIETALALGVMALVVASLSLMMADSMEQTRARAAADKVTQVYEASQGYIRANHAALLDQTAAGAVVIPSGRPDAGSPVPANSLQAGGFLPSGYIDSNGYGQRHSLVVRRLGTNGLQAIVTTHGGRPIEDARLGRIANLIGAAGGFTPSEYVNPADTNQIVGSYGGWRSPVADWGPPGVRPSAGTIQASLAFEDGNLLADYLYRNDIGIAEANRMNTHIDMNLNDLNNAANVRGIDVWADNNVTATNDVVAGANVTAGQDVTAQGNVTAAQGNVTASAGHVLASQDVRAGRDLTAAGSAYVAQNLSVGGSGSIAGDLGVTGMTTTGDLRASRMSLDTVVYNVSPGGNNRGLSGSEGIRLGDLLPRQVPQYSYYVTETTNDVVYKPNCGGDNSRARIMVLPQTESTRASTVTGTTGSASGSGSHQHSIPALTVDTETRIYAEDQSNTWRVRWTGTPAIPDVPRRAIALTLCFYE